MWLSRKIKMDSRFRGNDDKVVVNFESRLQVSTAEPCAATLQPPTSELIPDSSAVRREELFNRRMSGHPLGFGRREPLDDQLRCGNAPPA
jgi:hypothetical protein